MMAEAETTGPQGGDGPENVLKSLEENIKLVSEQIKDGECKRDSEQNFMKDEYWKRMSTIFKMLSTETTKISLAFSKKPFPSYKNTEQMVIQLEKTMLALVSTYYSLPISQGVSLRSHLQSAVLQILNCLSSFTASVSSCLASEQSSERLQWTGGVWDAADFVLLTDNQECVKKDLKDTLGLVGDALDEIEEAKENEGQVDDFLMAADQDSNPTTYSDQDKDVVDACAGLVKTTRMVLKKSLECVTKRGDPSTEAGISLLDEVVSLTKGASSRVDDFVCEIYAPINYSVILNNGQKLYEFTQTILKFLGDSPLTCPDDEKWLSYLVNANSHNLNKLQTTTAQNG